MFLHDRGALCKALEDVFGISLARSMLPAAASLQIDLLENQFKASYPNFGSISGCWPTWGIDESRWQVAKHC